MPSSSEQFIPILFKVLLGFVTLNIIINFILLYIRKMRMYKLLAAFWPAVFFVFIMQASFQHGDLPVTMAYSASLLSMSIFAMIGLEAIGRKFPWKKYLLYFAPFYPLTYFLAQQNLSFTTIAMPFAIATATPLIHAFIYIHIIDRRKTTKLQKLLGVVFFIMPIHCINFALFRMEPDAQLWGWLVAYAIYDMLAIILPSIALEQANLTEKERLERLVSERTDELKKSLKTNDSLFKVLVHDISNPLMVMKGYLNLYQKKASHQKIIMEKILKSQSVMEEIIHQVKRLHHLRNKDQIPLVPVSLNDCFKELNFLFEDSLKKKNITLKFNDTLTSETRVLADPISLTHSVLSNLLSNSIKFAQPNSTIEINTSERKNQVCLEVKDQGPGIPETMIKDIMSDRTYASTEGSQGEKGSGLGLSIVKSFIDSYGGQLEFETSFMQTTPADFGTKIKITLDRA
jgi:signal transduction histidine kinase